MKSAAERKREQRRRTRAEGRCDVCCTALARAGMVTCARCSGAAYERVKVRRNRAKRTE